MEKQEFIRKYVADRHNTDSLKWDGLQEKFGNNDLLPMWIADMEFKTCDAIIDAMVKRCAHGIFGYSSVPDEYYTEFSGWMEKRYGFPLKKDWIRFSTGCVTAISWMINAFTQPGDPCMILTPVYYPFYNVVTNNNRKLVEVDLKYDNGYFEMDFEAIEKAIVENHVKMFLQCSPHNPAGRVWTEDELDSVLKICATHNVIVVSDEIHQDLVLIERPFVPAAVVSNGKYKDIVLTLSSASKTFNLATLLHSHIIIIDDEMRKQYDRFASGINRTEISIMGMIATQAGYKYGTDWLKNVLDVVRDNYDYLKTELKRNLPEITVCALEGTYLAFLDISAYINPDKICDFIQSKCYLAVDYGEWFGKKYKGFIRINLATDPAYVEQAVKNIVTEINKLDAACEN